jgi:parvulin-like peptidyl-prolyl isomerase
MSNRAMIHGLLKLLPGAMALLVFACSGKPRLVQEGPITSQTIVVTVDTAKITLGEVLGEYTGMTVPSSKFPATLENALNEVTYRKCAFLGADKYKGYDKKEIDRAVLNRASDIIIQYMLQELFAKKVQVSESSIDSAYRANLASLSEPERRRVTHLLISTNPKAWEADGVNVSGLSAEQLNEKARAQIEKFYQEVKEGANLGDLAAKYSHDSNSKPKRGDTGLFTRGQMVDAFEKVAFRLPKGALSTPFKTQYGWHILRVDEIVDSTVQPLDSALHAAIERKLKSDMLQSMAGHFADSVILAAKLVWNEPLLQKRPTEYDPKDWILIVNGTDTMKVGILRELELMYSTGGHRPPVTPDVRKEIVLSKMPAYALMSAARQLGYADSDPMKKTIRDIFREEVVNRIYLDRTSVTNNLPTEDELQRYYEQHKEDYISDKPLKVQQIILKDSTEAAEVKRQAVAGVDFKELAQKYSPGEPESKEAAFDLGWISEKEMGTEFYGAAWVVDVGKYAGPVQTRWGWHVIKVLGHKPMANFAAARLDVQQRLRQEQMRDANEKWVKKVTSGHDIVRYDDILKQVKVDLPNRDHYFQLADSLARVKAATDTVRSGS